MVLAEPAASHICAVSAETSQVFDVKKLQNKIDCRAYDRVGRCVDKAVSPETRKTAARKERKVHMMRQAHATAILLFNAGEPEMSEEDCRRFAA